VCTCLKGVRHDANVASGFWAHAIWDWKPTIAGQVTAYMCLPTKAELQSCVGIR
jgi:hypothetical protein